VVVSVVGCGCGLPSPVSAVAAGAVASAAAPLFVGATAFSGAAGAVGATLHAAMNSPHKTSKIDIRFKVICILLQWNS
jgi:hypothetical protein